ncbi:MAG TPA: TlpA disulfide reductase family protein [Candidatus Eisenbacteria bacterium]|nr:TlpA disulfide reductase family protein [Candidatus Eisenbacteria bacterium]
MILKTASLSTLILAVTVGCGDATETKSKATTATTTTKVSTEKSAVSKPAVDTSQLQAAPAWSLVNLEGKPVSSESLKGKVLIVDFWATWCGPCRASIPHLVALQNTYKAKGFEVVGVSLDQQGPAVVEAFVNKYEIPYTIVMGNQKVVDSFGGVRGIPTAFIISQDGKIYRKIVGLVGKEQYEKDVKALLGVS